jgi:quinol monooxygenase YgiN
MHAVINTLRFKDSVDLAVFMRAEHELADQMRALEGFQSFRVVQVADDQVVMVIFADTAEVLDRMATELGNAWMGAHVAPLLDGPPDRRLGPVIASVSV